MYLNIYIYGVRSLSCDFIIYRTTPSHLAPSSTTGILLIFFFLFLITRTLKHDDLVAQFSATSLTEFD